MIRFVKPSKAVTDGQKSSASLEAAAFEIAADVGAAMERTLRPWLEEGETLPASEELRQHLLGRWLQSVRKRMIAADEAHQEEVWAERRLRRKRKTDSDTIRGTVRAIRNTFEKVYGEGLTAETVGLISDIPDDPVVVHRFSRRIVRVMMAPALELPEPQVQGSAMGPQDVVEQLAPHVERLGETLDLLETQKRRTQLALQEKREALEAFEFADGRVARYLEALCFLAGKDFHGDRVRQSSHAKQEPDEGPDVDVEPQEPAEPEEGEAEEASRATESEEPEESPTLEN